MPYSFLDPVKLFNRKRQRYMLPIIMRRSLYGLIISLVMAGVTGCSHTIYKREPDKSDPTDQGSETKIQIRGPKAVVKHSF